MREIELLSPAKTAEHGIEAVNHGADAVYIGAPKFGARVAVPNTVSDISRLVDYAHKYRSKVYVALNTILNDKELEDARSIIYDLYEVGVDALIIQDLGITMLDLPPIALHASTQTDNRFVEKVQFLESVGFEQVVLARELTKEQIKEISESTSVRLEAFVHGALCVSYSGQCYMSQAVCGRSANRGACAQMCRLPYTLTDADDNVILRNKHILSLKDLNLSSYLADMIDAGVSSFKIEGRLKEMSYVKNVTSFYRKKLDAIIYENDCLCKSSSGKCHFYFEPDLNKTFHRGYTDYFYNGRHGDIWSVDSPKALGEYVGDVKEVSGNKLTLKTKSTFSNGDGFCFFNEKKELEGFKANRVEDNRITLSSPLRIKKGTSVYRNFDQQFERLLSKKSAERKVEVNITLAEAECGFRIAATCEDGVSVMLDFENEKVEAENKQKSLETIKIQLKKSGDTIFEVKNVSVITEKCYFVPAGRLSDWRRQILLILEKERSKFFCKIPVGRTETKMLYPQKKLDYRANVHNKKAKLFYEANGAKVLRTSFESGVRSGDEELMRCKHCLKYSLGACVKSGGTIRLKEPLYIINSNKERFRLKFDCSICEMIVTK